MSFLLYFGIDRDWGIKRAKNGECFLADVGVLAESTGLKKLNLITNIMIRIIYQTKKNYICVSMFQNWINPYTQRQLYSRSKDIN